MAGAEDGRESEAEGVPLTTPLESEMKNAFFGINVPIPLTLTLTPNLN